MINTNTIQPDVIKTLDGFFQSYKVIEFTCGASEDAGVDLELLKGTTHDADGDTLYFWLKANGIMNVCGMSMTWRETVRFKVCFSRDQFVARALKEWQEATQKEGIQEP